MPGLFNEIDRFTEQNQGNAACSFCGQHAREKSVELPDGTRETRRARVFRTNLHIHMEGWVEVCEWCLLEAAQTIGLDTETTVSALQADIAALRAGLDVTEEAIAEKAGMVRSLAGELATAAEEHAAKLAAAYDRGYTQGGADAEAGWSAEETVDAGS